MLLKYLLKLRNIINQCVHDNGADYTTFGILGLIIYPLFYYMSQHFALTYDSNFYLRVVATVLCIPLAASQYWPRRFRRWLPTYWYITLLYCLAFFFTILILENRTSNPAWVVSMPFLLLWLMLLVDAVSFIILFTIGTILGLLVSYQLMPTGISQSDYFVLISQYAIFLAATMYLSYRKTKSKEVQDKTLAIKPVAAGIAHEIRTPLASISAGASGVKQYLSILLDAYQQAKQQGLPVGMIREIHSKQLTDTLDKIIRETYYANTIIDMMLMQVNHASINPGTFRHYSINECVTEALDRYPFIADTRDKLIIYNETHDFIFNGDKLLFIHIIFNLLKNAIYFTAEANKGKIYLSVETSNKYNSLHFKDTGTGIPEAHLNQIFKDFYTTTPNGSGIGLAFCRNVMDSMGGKITCDSVYGEYTEFILHFPVIAASKKIQH